MRGGVSMLYVWTGRTSRPDDARKVMRSPVKMGWSLSTPSRFLSAPPMEMLKGAPEASRRIVKKRR
jgi:hypothetical protein